MNLFNIVLLGLLSVCVLYQFEAGLQGFIALFLLILMIEVGRMRQALADIYTKLAQGIELEEAEPTQETTHWFVNGDMEQRQ